ncbi:MAG: IPT/TIG domain-containing protein [Bacteroides sp.]|nr:IPT/TIG domain-containing protein [Bacteroides sp.]MCI1681673.1 IPT/TIG domain-containing protein [Bacteroides sp.]
MKQYNKWGLIFLTVSILVWSSCDSISMNDFTASAPQILSFSPGSGSVGSEIVVIGENLDDVVSASIGGEEVTILQKVSNQRLSLKVTNNAKSGKITLSNSVGKGTSDTDFTLEYPAPSITTTNMPTEVEMGNKLLLSGSHMNVISAVIFTAAGYSTGNEANILSQTENEILVKIPYVGSDQASITFKYFNGTEDVETPIASAPQITVKRYEPNVTTSFFEPVTVGEIVTLNGTYLNKIDKVLLNDQECNITVQNENELKFAVPASQDYVDGDNTRTLRISYFDGREVHTLTENFTIKVLSIYFWENKKVYGQGRDVESMASFFSPETGLVYANSDWREVVDPISYKYQEQTCSAYNTPNVSNEEYESVNPYFFFSGANAGQLQINSPAGSSGQLRNFYWFNNSANEYRVTGAKANCYGTPVLTFLYLDPSNSKYKALADKVKNGTLTTIDEATFPINVDAKTCGEISIASMKSSLNTDVWANGIFTVGEEKQANVDAVILILYYNVNGSAANVAANVKRIGLLHIKTVDFKMWNNTSAPSSSSVEFDIYWQKHDYDYSKVQ